MSKWIASIVVCLFIVYFPAQAAADYEASINCETGTFNSNDPNDPGPVTKKHRSYLNPGGWMRWEVTIPKDATGFVEIEFKKKQDGDGYTKGVSPFEDERPELIFSLEKEKEKIKWGRIKKEIKKDTFGYRVLCTYTDKDGNPHSSIIDPIIEIPRPSISEVSPTKN